MHIDMSQSVIHYNHYQSKDSVNCEHTLGDKKNALFTVQRFPRGILVDWFVLLLDHNFANTFQFSHCNFERRTKSQHYFQNLFLWRKDAHCALHRDNLMLHKGLFHSILMCLPNKISWNLQNKTKCTILTFHQIEF